MERVLNQYKRETYISISSYTVWRGSHFVDYTQVHLGDALAVAIHRAGFGTFNDADAGKQRIVSMTQTREYILWTLIIMCCWIFMTIVFCLNCKIKTLSVVSEALNCLVKNIIG